jgi:hypothetical protein
MERRFLIGPIKFNDIFDVNKLNIVIKAGRPIITELTNSYIYDDLSEVFFLFFIDDLC